MSIRKETIKIRLQSNETKRKVQQRKYTKPQFSYLNRWIVKKIKAKLATLRLENEKNHLKILIIINMRILWTALCQYLRKWISNYQIPWKTYLSKTGTRIIFKNLNSPPISIKATESVLKICPQILPTQGALLVNSPSVYKKITQLCANWSREH